MPPAPTLSFDNTEIAFRGKSDRDIQRAYWLFRVIGNRTLTKVGPVLTNFAMKIGLPISGLIKSTVFRQFCGGETIDECEATIQQLSSGNVGTILDYSVEGGEEEKSFTRTAEEIVRTISRARGDDRIPLAVFKMTGVGRFSLLAKLDAGSSLTVGEQAEYVRLKARVDMICRAASESEVPVMIDAEESWIQDTIDQLALEMMKRYNREQVVVYQTYQLYRHDKLALLMADIQQGRSDGFMVGAKLVRGAYMEKERSRAAERGYPSPIQPDKASTDRDYNAAATFCLEHLDTVALVAGTHNEDSCREIVAIVAENGISPGHPHLLFSQLLGMSDNLSFNLADAGYRVAKYVPYGPLEAVMPYLFRRVEENTSIAGQTGRELSLIIKEKRRRKLNA